jgi:hypothetical protein
LQINIEPTVHKDREKKRKIEIKITKIINKFHKNGSVLAEPLTDADGASEFPEAKTIP